MHAQSTDFSGQVQRSLGHSKSLSCRPQAGWRGLSMLALRASCWPRWAPGKFKSLKDLKSFSLFATASVSPPVGSTAGRTMWGSACNRGWSRMASRTRWCTKAPFWTRQTDLMQRSHRGLHDTGTRTLCPYRDLKHWVKCVMLYFSWNVKQFWYNYKYKIKSIVIHQSLITGWKDNSLDLRWMLFFFFYPLVRHRHCFCRFVRRV